MGLKMKSEQLIKLVADIGGEEPNNNPMAGANIDPDAEELCSVCDKSVEDCTCGAEPVDEPPTVESLKALPPGIPHPKVFLKGDYLVIDYKELISFLAKKGVVVNPKASVGTGYVSLEIVSGAE